MKAKTGVFPKGLSQLENNTKFIDVNSNSIGDETHFLDYMWKI